MQYGFRTGLRYRYNWENTEIISRAFGNDPERVAKMSAAYLKGAHTIPGFACAAKHFPGNGQDFRDAHLSNNVNYFSVEEWDKTYGMVYKTLIDNGLDAIMQDISCCRNTQEPSIRI